MPETVYPVLMKDESGRSASPIVRTSTIYNDAGNPIGDFVSESELSDQFNTTKAYAKGDYCIKDNTVYKFTAAKSAGAWDSTKVLETKIADEVSLINSNLEYNIIDGRFFGAVPYGLSELYIVVPVIKMPSSVTTSNFALYYSGSWITVSPIYRGCYGKNVLLAINPTSSITFNNSYTYWLKGNVDIVY